MTFGDLQVNIVSTQKLPYFTIRVMTLGTNLVSRTLSGEATSPVFYLTNGSLLFKERNVLLKEQLFP